MYTNAIVNVYDGHQFIGSVTLHEFMFELAEKGLTVTLTQHQVHEDEVFVIIPSLGLTYKFNKTLEPWEFDQFDINMKDFPGFDFKETREIKPHSKEQLELLKERLEDAIREGNYE